MRWRYAAGNPIATGSQASRKRSYILSLLVLVMALGARTALTPLFGNYHPYTTVFVAIVFAAWHGGMGPSMMVAVLGFFAADFLFIDPVFSFRFEHSEEMAGAVAYLAASSVIIAIGEINYRNRKLLRSSREELESRVRERTVELESKNCHILAQAETLERNNQALKEMGTKLQHIQDAERARIARELHDGAGQVLAVLGINLSQLSGKCRKRCPELVTEIAESRALLKQVSADVRTISHLLHPPFLDLVGFEEAVRAYIAEYSQRSGVEVAVAINANIDSLSQNLRTAIFRIIQESLTNIYRHSGSQTATIHFNEEIGNLVVEVADQGHGIPREKLLQLSKGMGGVGMRGMQERVRSFGGKFEIKSGLNNTVLRVEVPRNAA